MSRFRWLVRQTHWLLGITLGVVLGLMGVTGATMAFEDQVMEGLSPGVANVAPRRVPTLSPDQLMAGFAAQRPDAKPSSLTLRAKAGASAQVTFKLDGAEHSQKLYLDPYDGRVLGPATGETFFAAVRRFHRWLLLPGDDEGIGRKVTGAAALSLVFFTLSGLYLRWPKRPLDWRIWLKPNLKLKKRGLYWSLHTVVGTWVFLVYLTIALTGLAWSYGWYEKAFDRVLTGKADGEAPAPPKPVLDPAKTPAPQRLDLAWRAAQRAVPDATQTIMTLPKPGAETIRVRRLPRGAWHAQAFDELKITENGVVVSNDRYAAKPLGEKIVTARLSAHRGAFFGLPGAIVFMLAALAMPLFPITGYLLYLGRRAPPRRPAFRA